MTTPDARYEDPAYDDPSETDPDVRDDFDAAPANPPEAESVLLAADPEPSEPSERSEPSEPSEPSASSEPSEPSEPVTAVATKSDSDWQELQGRFVDDPAAAVREAGAWVEHALAQLRSQLETGSTEDLRTAFRRYRELHSSLG